MTKITPVVLCGGSGTRLWPLSRKSFPKQFARIAGADTLFQASARRLSEPSRFEPPMVVTNSDFRFVVTEQLLEVGIDPGPVFVEPEGRNTAPAILAAALFAMERDPDAVLLAAPSDHLIPDTAAFDRAVHHGLDAIRQGRIVTFGIAPTRPETGYGYLELSAPPDGSGCATDLVRFVEKPDRDTAAHMLSESNFLWNAGIFLFRARDLLSAFERHAPDLIPDVRLAVETAEPDLGFLRLAPEPWSRLENISIDYAVMEKAGNLSVVPFSGDWSDLGDWQAVFRESTRDSDGVATSPCAHAIDCHDTMLRSENPDLQVVGIGLRNIIAVAMPDAVLIADMGRAQDVKQAVSLLKAQGAPQAETFPMDHRPWGHFETLALSDKDRFQVKRIVVKPGATLSLQSHMHRAEHWVVVSGTARVTIDDKVQLLTENQSVYIPLGARHRLENPGRVAMVLIEVQTGIYLGEDDIIRYEDLYARGQGAKG
ncbi:mannose-1-phosphate guanylyltransferase/mannose-6-phosphate isomerase [Oceaniglobus trochenteri]|uniref:mannose-1-phosphate guanylyltransferase/mannose-6-phosphate isomerase n=1 Tax=Oceaniglobus trochenteri TaxID=2763260 RepID=UPI001D00161D|nr:mannose-1-phosphate guanylyltransferase/mannose-6-phosphate isomerase [Oceaniglobus trochenteri]